MIPNNLLNAERKANQILIFIGQKKLPVNPINIAKVYGIDVLKISELGIDASEYESMDGFTACDKKTKKFKIVYNDRYKQRACFTVAHEFGHIKLNHFNSMLPYELMEKEANYFARCLLIPYGALDLLYDKLLKEKRYGKNIFISYTAKIFGVSEEAAGYAVFDYFLRYKKPGVNASEHNKIKENFMKEI